MMTLCRIIMAHLPKVALPVNQWWFCFLDKLEDLAPGTCFPASQSGGCSPGDSSSSPQVLTPCISYTGLLVAFLHDVLPKSEGCSVNLNTATTALTIISKLLISEFESFLAVTGHILVDSCKSRSQVMELLNYEDFNGQFEHRLCQHWGASWGSLPANTGSCFAHFGELCFYVS